MNYEIKQLAGLTCLVRYPEGFDSSRKYPAIVMLHGAGTRGRDPAPLVNNPFFQEVNRLEEFPFLVFAPLCDDISWYDRLPQLKALVQLASASSLVEEDRLYLMGASMGGYAAWQLAMSIPDYFAAIVPICGGGIYAFADRLKNVPAWAFHGQKDRVVYPEESVRMVEAVNSAGGSAKLTIYPENEHNAWSDTYSNPAVYRWLLSCRRNRGMERENNLSDPGLYG